MVFALVVGRRLLHIVDIDGWRMKDDGLQKERWNRKMDGGSEAFICLKQATFKDGATYGRYRALGRLSEKYLVRLGREITNKNREQHAGRTGY